MTDNLKIFDNFKLNLEIFAEEAGEVIEEATKNIQMTDMVKTLSRIQRIKSKIVRFGLKDYHPKNKVPNDQYLEKELGHLMAMVDILVDQGALNREAIETGRRNKIKNLPAYYTRKETHDSNQ